MNICTFNQQQLSADGHGIPPQRQAVNVVSHIRIPSYKMSDLKSESMYSNKLRRLGANI